jgi:hypothetical protein
MPDNTVTVRVGRGGFRYDREQFAEGQELDVTEETIQRHPRTLTRVEDAGDAADGDGETEDDPEATTDDTVDAVAEDDLDPHPSDLTVDDLKERLGDVDDVALLRGIRNAEEDNKGRSGALTAIDGRLADLEE